VPGTFLRPPLFEQVPRKENFRESISGLASNRLTVRRSSCDVRKSDMVLPCNSPGGDANRLNHLDSDFCWCDPLVKVDENRQEVVVHRQVTWS